MNRTLNDFRGSFENYERIDEKFYKSHYLLIVTYDKMNRAVYDRTKKNKS